MTPYVMKPVLRFTVYGLPAPQGSKRHVGNGRLIEQSARVAPWREAIVARAVDPKRPALQGPVWVRLDFSLPRPKSARKNDVLPSRRPDLDKLTRACLDALTTAGVFIDDGQVVDLIASKCYVGRNEGHLHVPGVSIAVGPVVVP